MFQINFLHLLNFIQKTEKMRKLILQFFEIIFSLLIPVTISASPDYDFTQINFDRGIPSRVSYVYEDNNSLIWMSTYEGLLRYDGKRLKSYHFDSGNNQMASNIEILQIMEDEKQQLWVLTNQGVFLYSAKHDKFTPYTWKNQLLQATSACKIDDGIIFGGTDTLYHYSYGQGEITKSEHLKTKNFQVLQLKLWNSHILVCSNRNRTVLFYDLKEQKEFSLPIIIRKTKCSCDLERNVLKRKTKRYRNTIFPKIFSTGLRRFFSYAKTGSEHHSDPVLSFCRFAPALTLYAYATSVAALYAATLDALTSLPRKARREPTCVLVFEASMSAFAYDTPPYAYA